MEEQVEKMFGSDYALTGFGDEVIVFLAILAVAVVIIVSYVYTAFQTEPMTPPTTSQESSSSFEGEIKTFLPIRGSIAVYIAG